MENIVNNSWFIGIVGGWISAILSAFFVFLATYIFTVVMQKKRIENANQFLIDHLRPYILKGTIPSEALTNALKFNAAKRFRVKQNDLLSLPNIIAEIAVEIVGNLYIKEEIKIEYLKNIESYLSEHPQLGYDFKKTFRPLVSISIVVSFITSALILTMASEIIKRDPHQINDLFKLIQNSTIYQRTISFFFLSELVFISLSIIPVTLTIVLRITRRAICDFVSFIKNHVLDKTDNK